MKIQQEQKEMTMKPWDRDIQELERYFQKSQEEQNIQMNSQSPLLKSFQAQNYHNFTAR